jgi:hypothetical protein
MSISDRDKAASALGKGALRSFPWSQLATNVTAGATTAAAGDLTGAEYCIAKYTLIGAANLTTRTAAQMIADSGLQIGDQFLVEIWNSNAGTLTLVGGTGVTISGTATVATGVSKYYVTVNADLTMTFTRVSP